MHREHPVDIDAGRHFVSAARAPNFCTGTLLHKRTRPRLDPRSGSLPPIMQQAAVALSRFGMLLTGCSYLPSVVPQQHDSSVCTEAGHPMKARPTSALLHA